METNFRYRASARVANPRIAQKITRVVTAVVTSKPWHWQSGGQKTKAAAGILRAGYPRAAGYFGEKRERLLLVCVLGLLAALLGGVLAGLSVAGLGVALRLAAFFLLRVFFFRRVLGQCDGGNAGGQGQS